MKTSCRMLKLVEMGHILLKVSILRFQNPSTLCPCHVQPHPIRVRLRSHKAGYKPHQIFFERHRLSQDTQVRTGKVFALHMVTAWHNKVQIYVVRRRGRLAPRQPLSVCALLPAYKRNRHLRPPGNLGHRLRRPRWID